MNFKSKKVYIQDVQQLSHNILMIDSLEHPKAKVVIRKW